MSHPLVNADSASSAPVEVDLGHAVMPRRAILILGMHRSGTSALTKVLNLCGLDLPADLLPGFPDNDRGFFEPRKVIGLHDVMLEALGSSWDDLGGIPTARLVGPETADYRHRLLEALREDLGQSRQFVIKDPRLCRLMPLWRLILAEFGAQPSCVLVIRNPLDIAASLEARNKFPTAKSLVLWVRHFLDSERHTRDLPRTFASYDALLENWKATVRRIEQDLSLGLSSRSAQTETQIREFLEPTLRHHLHSAQTWDESDISQAVRRAFAWGERAVAGEAVDSAELDEIGAEIDRAAAIFAPVVRAQQAALARAGRVAEDQAKSITEQSKQAALELERQSKEGERRALESSQRIAAAQQQAQEAEDRAVEAHRQTAAAQQQAKQAEDRAVEAHRQIAAAQQQAERRAVEAHQRIAAARRQAKEAERRAVEAHQRIAVVEHQIAEVRRLNEELTQKLDAQRAAADQLRDAAAARDRDLAAFRNQVDRFQASFSWRATAPLRFGVRLLQSLRTDTRFSGTNGMSKSQFRRARRRVAATGLFDPEYYLSRYADVAAAQIDPLDHYVLHGRAEKRDPHPLFHSGFYLDKYPDVAATNFDPLLHYAEYGARERRSPNRFFDSNYYLERYPDVAAAGMNPLHHYCLAGWRENRNPHPLFDGAYYLRRYPEVAKAKLNPLLHYLRWGILERRNPNPWFDVGWYLERYPDVAAAGIDALEHYICRGAAEGRDAGPVFNTTYYLQEHPWLIAEGVNPLIHWVTELASGRATERYWNRPTPLRRNLRPGRADATAAVANLKHKPLISILIPTFNTPVRYLKAAVDSVMAQTYPNWELCICDDSSEEESTLAALRELERGPDRRIRVSYRAANGGISRASNDALAMARGDYVAMLDHDDELLPDALLRIVQSIDQDPDVDVLYSDQAYMSAEGEEQEPLLKPDWSPRLLWGVMFVGHLLVVRREVASAVGGFRPQFDNVQDFEFMLRVSEKTRRIRHVPEILYFWRRAQGSVSRKGDAKGGIPARQAQAVNAHLRRIKVSAIAEPDDQHAHRLKLGPPKSAAQPPISVFVRPCGNASALNRCLDSILSKTRYEEFQVFVVGDQRPSDDLDRFGGRVKILPADPMLDRIDEPDDIAGDFWVSMSAELEILSPDWLAQMVFAASLPEAMYVCPLLLQPGGTTVEEAGLILGLDGSVGRALRGWLADSDGYAGSLTCMREVSAVSDWCVMASRQTALLRAPDEEAYQSGWHRMAHRSAYFGGKSGWNLYAPRAVLRRTLSAPAVGAAAEAERIDRMLFADLCHRAIERGDPFHNLNFSRVGSGYL
jgi:hypothetical protein